MRNPTVPGARQLVTADELYEMSEFHGNLVRGMLVAEPRPGFEHGRIEGLISWLLWDHVREHDLGVVCPGDTGFLLARSPDTVRGPDVAFVRKERVVRTRKFFEGPPDLAVEVRSPNDRARDIEEKVSAWLDAGTLEVWVADPDARTLTIHYEDRTRVELRAEDRIVSRVLPGLDSDAGGCFD